MDHHQNEKGGRAKGQKQTHESRNSRDAALQRTAFERVSAFMKRNPPSIRRSCLAMKFPSRRELMPPFSPATASMAACRSAALAATSIAALTVTAASPNCACQAESKGRRVTRTGSVNSMRARVAQGSASPSQIRGKRQRRCQSSTARSWPLIDPVRRPRGRHE